MMRKLFISVIAFSAIGACAQSGKSIPGYMGLRNTLSFNITPNIAPREFYFLQQLTHPAMSISYERATNRRNSFYCSFSTMTNAMDAEIVDNYQDNQNDQLYVKVNGSSSRIGGFDGTLTYNVKTITIGRGYYHLKSGSIAPQGKSFRIGLTYNIFKVVSDDLQYHVEYGSMSFKNPDNDYKSHGTFSVNMEFGSRRFITKHLFFRKSIAFNIPGNLWVAVRNKVFNNIEDYDETHLAFFVSKIQTLNVSVGIGAAF